jgi:hypothetical protein
MGDEVEIPEQPWVFSFGIAQKGALLEPRVGEQDRPEFLRG